MITQEEIDDYVKMMKGRYPYTPNFEAGIRIGIDYMIEREKINQLINIPKSHVAEVVKFGDVNKSAWQLQNEAYKAIGVKIHEDLMKNPEKYFGIGERSGKQFEKIMSPSEWDHAINQHPYPLEKPRLVDMPVLDCNKVKVNYPGIQCEHTYDHTSGSIGLYCTKCGKWFNHQND